MTLTDEIPRLTSALEGCHIVIAVDRRAAELRAALERHGAVVEQAPAMTIIPHSDDDALLDATRRLVAAPPDVVVATTGVGFRGWIEAAREAGIADDLTRALGGSRILARGPKARGAVLQAGLEVDWTARSETVGEVTDRLLAMGAAGLRIAVQHHGSGSDGADDLLRAHGADVVGLTVYRWGPPADPERLRRATASAAAGTVDAVAFTSAPSAEAWLAEAERRGHLDRIRDRAERGRLVMAAVGPVTAGPLEARGIPPLVATRGRLGSLVRSIVTHFGEGGAPTVRTDQGSLELRGRGAILDGRFLPLPPGSAAVLGALFDARGATVSRRELVDALPGTNQRPHAVESAASRLREALGRPGLIATVVKRGYRLAVSDET